jgi:hypothetical protein
MRLPALLTMLGDAIIDNNHQAIAPINDRSRVAALGIEFAARSFFARAGACR